MFFFSRNVTILLIILTGLTWSILGIFLERRARRARIQLREPWEEEQIMAAFPLNKGVDPKTVMRAWKEVASVLHIDSRLMRPDDSLLMMKSSNIAHFTDMENLEGLVHSVKCADKSSVSRLNSIGDVVWFIAENAKGSKEES